MSVAGVRWIELPNIEDERGVLTAMEGGVDVPFAIRRVFFLHGVRAARGGHAHRSSRQLLVPVAGTFRVEVRDSSQSMSYALTDPHRGLYVPPMTWVHLDDFSDDAVCLVLSDTAFDAAEYIRSWEVFARSSQPGHGAS